MLAVNVRDLFVEGEEIPQYAQAEETGAYQVEQTGEDLAHVEAVDTEQAQKGQQDPREVVVDGARHIASLRFAFHARDQEQVYDPADEEQAQGEEPDNTGYLLAVVKAVGSDKPEYPQQVTQ